MKSGLYVLVFAALAGCSFDSAPIQAAAPASDAGIVDAGANMDAQVPPPMPDAGRQSDASVPVADAAAPDAGELDAALSEGDSGMPPGHQGGLSCNGTFCPFSVLPVEQCCTSAADVEHGAARMADRCGLSYAATGSDFFGESCWQRDQLGIPDDSCPGVQVDLRSTEPGCCTDQGICGAFETEQGLGCHYDPYADAQQSCGVAPLPDAGSGDVCELSGLYALRFSTDMTWGGRSGGLWDLTDDGRGRLSVDMLVTIESVDDTTLELRATGRPCSSALPPFYSSTLCESYAPVFPESIWDSSSMPELQLTGRAQCLEPGCVTSIDALTVLLGVELENPESPWPTAQQTASLECPSGEGAECFPDHDSDDKAGLSIELLTDGEVPSATNTCRNGYERKGAPLSNSIAAIFDGVRRADRMQIGVRVKFGAAFTLDDKCEKAKGSGITEFVNSRSPGCMVQPGTANYGGQPAGANVACSAAERQFVDTNLPIYTVLDVGERPSSGLELADASPSTGTQVSLVRIADLGSDVTCEQVRTAAHP
jgi:hypothetical protein